MQLSEIVYGYIQGRTTFLRVKDMNGSENAVYDC